MTPALSIGEMNNRYDGMTGMMMLSSYADLKMESTGRIGGLFHRYEAILYSIQVVFNQSLIDSWYNSCGSLYRLIRQDMMRNLTAGDVRPSPIAGTWYPGKPEQLAATIEQLVAAAPDTKVPGVIRGLIVPHAGYRYSGPVAARAFRLLQGLSYERVVVISPMHHPYLASILTTAHSAYETPLGTIPVDHDVLEELSRCLPLVAVRNDPEHALEIELPFLQQVLVGEFRLVPLMLREQSGEVADEIGRVLARVLEGEHNTLLVASSDLSHFYTDAAARELDRHLMELIAANDPMGIIRAEEDGIAFACGRGAIASVLVACKGLGASEILITGYGTSGDTSGDRIRVVGYGSAVIFQPEG